MARSCGDVDSAVEQALRRIDVPVEDDRGELLKHEEQA